MLHQPCYSCHLFFLDPVSVLRLADPRLADGLHVLPALDEEARRQVAHLRLQHLRGYRSGSIDDTPPARAPAKNFPVSDDHLQLAHLRQHVRRSGARQRSHGRLLHDVHVLVLEGDLYREPSAVPATRLAEASEESKICAHREDAHESVGRRITRVVIAKLTVLAIEDLLARPRRSP